MTTHARVFRPVTGPLAVRLPYRPDGGNYDLLKDLCGERTRPRWDRERRVFVVARTHLSFLLDGLVAEFGAVELTTEYHLLHTCAAACWTARPDTWPDCVCACGATNHGTREPIGPLVADGAASVSHEYFRRTTVLRG